MPGSLLAARGWRWRHKPNHPVAHIPLEGGERMANKPVLHSTLSSMTEGTLPGQSEEPQRHQVALCSHLSGQSWSSRVSKRRPVLLFSKASRILIRRICSKNRSLPYHAGLFLFPHNKPTTQQILIYPFYKWKTEAERFRNFPEIIQLIRRKAPESMSEDHRQKKLCQLLQDVFEQVIHFSICRSKMA